MLSTMLRGLAFGYWLPAIRMPQDIGVTCEWWAEGSAQGAHKHRGAVPDPRGGDPLPGGVEICTTLADSLNPPQVSVRISRRFIKY